MILEAVIFGGREYGISWGKSGIIVYSQSNHRNTIMLRENTYRTRGGVPNATRDFLGPHFENVPPCAPIFEREKSHHHQKKVAQSIRLDVYPHIRFII